MLVFYFHAPKYPPTFSRLARFATYEDEYFRLNENTIKNGNSTKFANGARRVLCGVFLFK